MNLLPRRTSTPTSGKRGRHELAKALAKAPTRASRDELLLLQNR